MPWFSFRSASTRQRDLLDPSSDSPEIAVGTNKESRESKKKGTIKRAVLQPNIEQELQFYTQLAHGGSTKRINAFMSLKDLYSKLALELDIDIRTIMFCTLNNPKIDMRHLLSGLVVYNDFIFVHIQGMVRQISVIKEEKAIGITITDNGMGCSFIKRVKAGSVAERSGNFHVGDQLVKLGESSLVGSRHYAVAAKLRDVPIGSLLELVLAEPKQGFDSNLCPRRTAAGGQSPAAADPIEDGRATVRIKSDGTVQDSVACNWLEKAKLQVDDLLESYMGIRDLELACTILETSDEHSGKEEFTTAVNDILGDFDFPEDFIENVWEIIALARETSEEKEIDATEEVDEPDVVEKEQS